MCTLALEETAVMDYLLDFAGISVRMAHTIFDDGIVGPRAFPKSAELSACVYAAVEANELSCLERCLLVYKVKIFVCHLISEIMFRQLV